MLENIVWRRLNNVVTCTTCVQRKCKSVVILTLFEGRTIYLLKNCVLVFKPIYTVCVILLWSVNFLICWCLYKKNCIMCILCTPRSTYRPTLDQCRVLSSFLVRWPKSNYRQLNFRPEGWDKVRRAKLLRGSGGMPPGKFWNSMFAEIRFPAIWGTNFCI